ncbi:MAG: type II toxin-antitoxin system HicB family antitoxin, partial [Chitinophagales bacterium]
MENVIKTSGNKSIEIQLGVLIFQEGDSYLAYCPALELSTYGDSINDAKEAFEDLITSYAEDCQKMGTLEKDLAAHGWVMQPASGMVQPPKEFDIDIPAGMLRKSYN